MKTRSLALFYDVAYPFVEGGGQRRLFEIATRLAQRGWHIDWFTLKTWGGEATQQAHGITYHGLAGDTRLYDEQGRRRVGEALSYGYAILRTRLLYRHYDIIWCGQWPFFHLLALLLHGAPLRSNLVVDWWEVWGGHWFSYRRLLGLGGWFAEALLANIVGRLGTIVSISTLGLRQLHALGVPRKRSHYIPNGLDLAAFARTGPASGRVDLIYFGRLKDHKNVDHLLRAMALLKAQGRNLTCDIIGDGPERSELETLAGELDLTSQVVFHGSVDDQRLISLLKRARLFVHPSTKEGGGSITLLEANACGLPVVCYDHPRGIDPGQIRQRETGLLVTPVAPEGLAAGITDMLALCESHPVREACVTHAADFGWDTIAARYEALFDGLVSRTMLRIQQKARRS